MFIVGLIVGWILGSTITAILLAKRNFEKMQKISEGAIDKATDSLNLAKATFDYYKLTPEERAAKEAAEAAAEAEEQGEETVSAEE